MKQLNLNQRKILQELQGETESRSLAFRAEQPDQLAPELDRRPEIEPGTIKERTGTQAC